MRMVGGGGEMLVPAHFCEKWLNHHPPDQCCVLFEYSYSREDRLYSELNKPQVGARSL